MRISKLFGRAITDGKKRGFIIGVDYSGDRICAFECCTANGGEFTADAKGFYESGEEIVFLSSAPKGGAPRLKLGRPAYNFDGAFLGYFEDCTARGNRLVKAKIGKKTYPFSQLIIGDAVILKNPEYTAKDMFIGAICGG